MRAHMMTHMNWPSAWKPPRRSLPSADRLAPDETSLASSARAAKQLAPADLRPCLRQRMTTVPVARGLERRNRKFYGGADFGDGGCRRHGC